jgi:hypothetical protein
VTPREYIEQLRALVHSSQNAEAMAFAERWAPSVYPRMTAQEYERATTLLELPSKLLDAEAWRAAKTEQPKTPSQR